MPAHKDWLDLIQAPEGFKNLTGDPREDWPDEFCWPWPWLGGHINGHIRKPKSTCLWVYQRAKAVYRHEGKRIHPIRLIYPYFTECDPDAHIRLRRQPKLDGTAREKHDNVNPYFYEIYEPKTQRPQATKRPKEIPALFDLWPLDLPAPTSVDEVLARFPDLKSERTCDLELTIKNM